MRVRSLAIAGTALAIAAAAGDARGQTLEQALVAAYTHNPTLAGQRAGVRATDEQVPQALSNWRPTITGDGDAGVETVENTAVTGTTRTQSRKPRSFGVTLSQPIFRGGRTVAAVRGAENAVRAERARLADVEQSVLLAAATAYADVYRDQAVLNLTIANEQRLRRQLEATRDRFEVGEVTRTDVFQAEARLAGATADRIGAEGDLQASRAAYRNVVGEVPGTLVRADPPGGLPPSLEGAVGTASDDNPDVVGAAFDERSARDFVDEVRGELYPEISLQGSATRSYDLGAEDNRVDDLAATLTLTVPLYQSGAVYSRLREAKQTAAERRLDLEQARRDAVESATRAWNDLEAARAQVQSFKKGVEANEVALEGVEREAAVGARTVLDILDAEQELLDSQVDLVRAERDVLVAAFELKTAVGGMTAAALALPVELYDAEAHYDEVRGRWFGGSASGEVPATDPPSSGRR